jgi:hypothetical protein
MKRYQIFDFAEATSHITDQTTDFMHFLKLFQQQKFNASRKSIHFQFQAGLFDP